MAGRIAEAVVRAARDEGVGRPLADDAIRAPSLPRGGSRATSRSARPDDDRLLLSVAKIVVIDLALAGDNAVVIALAVRTLPRRHQVLGRVWGTVGAVALRIAFIAVATYLLSIPLLQVGGGLLLLWIAVKLVRQSAEGGGHRGVRNGTTLGEAIWIIVIADVV